MQDAGNTGECSDSILFHSRWFATATYWPTTEGTLLPDLWAARRHAERIIKKLRRKNGYDDPALIMRVKDEAHRTVLFLPIIPSD